MSIQKNFLAFSIVALYAACLPAWASLAEEQGLEDELNLSEESKLSQDSLQDLRGGYQSGKLQLNIGIEKVTVINGEVVATVNSTVQGYNAPTSTGIGAAVQAKVDALIAAAQAKIQQATGNIQAQVVTVTGGAVSPSQIVPNAGSSVAGGTSAIVDTTTTNQPSSTGLVSAPDPSSDGDTSSGADASTIHTNTNGQQVLSDMNSTIIQNSLDNQTIQVYTIIDLELLNLANLRFVPLSEALQRGLIQAAAAR